MLSTLKDGQIRESLELVDLGKLIGRAIVRTLIRPVLNAKVEPGFCFLLSTASCIA